MEFRIKEYVKVTSTASTMHNQIGIVVDVVIDKGFSIKVRLLRQKYALYFSPQELIRIVSKKEIKLGLLPKYK